jgi:hypothetical protein
MTRSWLPICSMHASWKRTLRSCTCSTFPIRKMQWLTTYQLRSQLRLRFRMECWKEDYGNLQLGQPTQVKGARPAP